MVSADTLALALDYFSTWIHFPVSKYSYYSTRLLAIAIAICSFSISIQLAPTKTLFTNLITICRSLSQCRWYNIYFCECVRARSYIYVYVCISWLEIVHSRKNRNHNKLYNICMCVSLLARNCIHGKEK